MKKLLEVCVDSLASARAAQADAFIRALPQGYGILQRLSRGRPEPLPRTAASDQGRVQPAGALPDAPPGG